MNETALAEYYARRAHEYDRIYEKPERQSDLRALGRWLTEQTGKRSVLDLACGTGYWAERLQSGAKQYCGIDSSEAVLDVARSRLPKVEFLVDDAYHFEQLPFEVDTVVLGFWWSHVPIQRIDSFLRHIRNRVEPGARVLIFDNRYVAGSNHPVVRKDRAGNTYQVRRLDDGDQFEVLKNFPDQAQVCDAFASYGTVEYRPLTYYWMCRVDLY